MEKSIILIFIFFLFLLSCTEKRQGAIYANNDEVTIINNMDCWSSTWAEGLVVTIALNPNKSNDRKWKKWHKLKDEVRLKGRESLYNDTLFIDIVRSDTLFKHMLAQRQIFSNKIKSYTIKIPFFKKEINEISEDIVEYKYNSSNKWGLYLYDLNKTFLPHEKFYSNYSEYLKDGYSLIENANVKESDIVEFNELLKEIEVLDRRLWMLKYFESAKIEVEKELAEQNRITF
jgi:hypothetical protein